ncbi:MAG: SIR2 family protein [Alphaproteobacteria bacterium]|nr:SIR2 family protein [Alphaproteobacteria bacterium]
MNLETWHADLPDTTKSGLVDLAATIRRGDCVAFVGAGFSAGAGLPNWWRLLDRICACAEGGLAASAPEVELVRKRLDAKRLQEDGSTRPFDPGEAEMLAQLLKDAMSEEGAFQNALTQALGQPNETAAFRRRRSNLLQVPFRAILTTNFDGLLPGVYPQADAYRRLLREEEHWSWAHRFWPDPTGGAPSGAPVYQLHGNLDSSDSIVFTKGDYRARLYGSRGYLDFLKALMASRTFLFLGFSLGDEYLNLLRSDLLELLGGTATLAYAVMPLLPPAEATYYQKHEGIHVLPYTSHTGHADFDKYLDWLAVNTNPIRELRTLLQGRRVLWVDPNPQNNALALQQLGLAGNRGFTQLTSHREALSQLGAGADWDLVITNWGRGQGASARSQAEDFLAQLRSRPDQPPVIVFASDWQANRWRALRAGAFAYTWTWAGLFKEIRRVMRARDAMDTNGPSGV